MTSNSSLSLRQATQADAALVAEVHVRSWQVAYRGIIPEDFLNALSPRARANRYTFDKTGPNNPITWLALVEDDVVGLVTVGPSQDEGAPGVGEIQALYVASSHWRCGAGSLLMGKAEALLASVGFCEASLWVLEANTRGQKFYEELGWQADGQTKIEVIGGRSLVEFRYRKDLDVDKS